MPLGLDIVYALRYFSNVMTFHNEKRRRLQMHAGRSRKDRITKKCDSDKLSATIDIKLDDDNDDDLLTGQSQN